MRNIRKVQYRHRRRCESHVRLMFPGPETASYADSREFVGTSDRRFSFSLQLEILIHSTSPSGDSSGRLSAGPWMPRTRARASRGRLAWRGARRPGCRWGCLPRTNSPRALEPSSNRKVQSARQACSWSPAPVGFGRKGPLPSCWARMRSPLVRRNLHAVLRGAPEAWIRITQPRARRSGSRPIAVRTEVISCE